jgi:hypothetical protein
VCRLVCDCPRSLCLLSFYVYLFLCLSLSALSLSRSLSSLFTHVCVCACMCVCLSMCARLFAFVYVIMCTLSLSLYLLLFLSLNMRDCMCVCVCMYVHVCLWLSMWSLHSYSFGCLFSVILCCNGCVCVCVCMCVFVLPRASVLSQLLFWPMNAFCPLFVPEYTFLCVFLVFFAYTDVQLSFPLCTALVASLSLLSITFGFNNLLKIGLSPTTSNAVDMTQTVAVTVMSSRAAYSHVPLASPPRTCTTQLPHWPQYALTIMLLSLQKASATTILLSLLLL